MIEIISKGRTIHSTSYFHEFRWLDDNSSGFMFDCLEDGTLLPDTPERAKENYEKCISGELDVRDLGIQEVHHDWYEPALGRCVCRRIVSLEGFTNTCRCGREYNSYGQELAARESWGEETGEHPADIGQIR
jgi:hypothetical protein